jgi:hypothetical protein
MAEAREQEEPEPTEENALADDWRRASGLLVLDVSQRMTQVASTAHRAALQAIHPILL